MRYVAPTGAPTSLVILFTQRPRRRPERRLGPTRASSGAVCAQCSDCAPSLSGDKGGEAIIGSLPHLGRHGVVRGGWPRGPQMEAQSVVPLKTSVESRGVEPPTSRVRSDLRVS